MMRHKLTLLNYVVCKTEGYSIYVILPLKEPEYILMLNACKRKRGTKTKQFIINRVKFLIEDIFLFGKSLDVTENELKDKTSPDDSKCIIQMDYDIPFTVGGYRIKDNTCTYPPTLGMHGSPLEIYTHYIGRIGLPEYAVIIRLNKKDRYDDSGKNLIRNPKNIRSTPIEAKDLTEAEGYLSFINLRADENEQNSNNK